MAGGLRLSEKWYHAKQATGEKCERGAVSPHFRVQSGTFSMKSKKSAACRKSQSGLFLQAETGGACPRPSAFFGGVGADGRWTQPTGHRRRYGVSRRCKGPSDRRTPVGTSNRGAAAPLCLVVLRGGLSRRGKSKSPSLTDSFAPFWSFRKGPAGGRSPSEME